MTATLTTDEKRICPWLRWMLLLFLVPTAGLLGIVGGVASIALLIGEFSNCPSQGFAVCALALLWGFLLFIPTVSLVLLFFCIIVGPKRVARSSRLYWITVVFGALSEIETFWILLGPFFSATPPAHPINALTMLLFTIPAIIGLWIIVCLVKERSDWTKGI